MSISCFFRRKPLILYNTYIINLARSHFQPCIIWHFCWFLLLPFVIIIVISIYSPDFLDKIRGLKIRATVKRLPQLASRDAKMLLSGFSVFLFIFLVIFMNVNEVYSWLPRPSSGESVSRGRNKMA